MGGEWQGSGIKRKERGIIRTTCPYRKSFSMSWDRTIFCLLGYMGTMGYK